MNGFRGGFGGGNMQNIMRQAQKMQEDLQKTQEELKSMEVEGSAGGGMVTVKVSGDKEFLGISLKKEAVDPDDVEMLEDLIKVAILDANKKADELKAEKLGAFGNLGGLF